MTEEEAKKKWCPEARIQSGGAYNRDAQGNAPKQAFCLGSACMMWEPLWNEQADATMKDIGDCGLKR